MYDVSVVKYEKPLESLRQAVGLAGGLDNISADSKVVLKPNLVAWFEGINFPKYGVLTTARMMEDMVIILKENGIDDITIAEGGLEEKINPDVSLLDLTVRGMGLDFLKKRYGIKIVDVMKSPYTKVTVDDVALSVCTAVLETDHVINMPVLKTHSQAMVSLGLKNLKGVLSQKSRKVCHNPDFTIDLHYHIAKLLDMVTPSLTIIDGIYSNERGPMHTGFAHRANVIIVSKDTVSADIVGATVLGLDPETVPHIAIAAKDKGRSTDLKDIEIKGGLDIKSILKPHAWAFEQNESDTMPLFFEKAGVTGITFYAVDTSPCTYCMEPMNLVTMGLLTAKNKNFDDIEVLYGKVREPTPGHKHTLLVGQCMVKKNRKDPRINHCVKIPGCPAKREDFLKACDELGIELMDNFMEWIAKSPETVNMKKYLGKPEYDPSFYEIRD